MDAAQPWEELDAQGNIISQARDYFGDKLSSAINPDSEFIPGVERDGESASGITENGEALTLTSGDAGSGGLGWAYYRLTMGGEQPGVVSCDVNPLPGDGGIPSEYYVGLADYDRGAWEWWGPYADSHVRLSTGADVAAGTDYLSPLGNLFVCVVAFDGASIDVVGVAANAYDAGDTTAPPMPAGLTLTPVAGGLELSWNGVVAGDLAGYSIYYDTKWFYNGAYPGVHTIGVLEGTTRYVLTGLSDATHVRVRVGAVDVSGNESELSELVFALPLAGDAPELTLMTSEPSGMLNDAITLSATGAESYDWDVDGDGIYDITGNPSGSASVNTSRTGIIRPSVRGTSSEGTMVACGGVSVIVASNSRPVANGHADPASGPATLTTTLTGEGVDFDGTIVQYAWDLDDDGVYNWVNMVSGNVGPRNYPNPGLYNVKFRVTDDQGAWDVDTITVDVQHNMPPVAVLQASLVTVFLDGGDGQVALIGNASYDPEGGGLSYWFDGLGTGDEAFNGLDNMTWTYTTPGEYLARLRVVDPQGATGYSTVLIKVCSFSTFTADPEPNNFHYMSMADINGKPAVAYYDIAFGDLRFVRATNPTGTTWGEPAIVQSTGDVGEYCSLALVAGHPAISYYDDTADNLMFIRADEPHGDYWTWSTPVVVDSVGAVGKYTSLVVVAGRPCISYYDNDVTRLNLKFIRASAEDGSTWSFPLTLENAGNVGQHTSLAVVDGNPAIAYYDSTNTALKYIRATNNSGTSWGAPITLDSSGDVGSYTSLVVVNGHPAIAYKGEGVKYIRANNNTGATLPDWGAPQMLLASSWLGMYASLAVVQDRPAISYYNSGVYYLQYIWATDTAGSSWGDPVLVDYAGFGTGQFCDLEVIHNRPLIAYYGGGATLSVAVPATQ